MNHTDPHDRSPALAELLDDAFVVPVDVETAARHLWAIHTEANRLAEESPSPSAPVVDERQLVGAGAGGGRRSVPRAAVPLLVIVMMMSSSGMALAASQSSLPGDVLYPVKRGTEQAQLIFARSPEARAQLQLSFARARLDEIRQIATTRPQHVPALVAAINVTLTAVDSSAAEAAPDSERIRQEVTEVTAEIAAMELPPEAEEAVDVALSTPTATPAPTQTTPEVPLAETPNAQVSATPAPSATPTPSATATEGAGGATEGAAGAQTGASEGSSTPGAVPTPTGSASPSPSPTPSPSPSPTPSDGPIVTARPQVGDSGGGSSRSDDGSEEPVAGEQPGTPSEAPTSPETPSEQPALPPEPYVRPVDGN